MFVFSLKMRICNLQIHICNLKMDYNPSIVRFSPAERKVFSCLWQVSGIKNPRRRMGDGENLTWIRPWRTNRAYASAFILRQA